MNNIQTPPTDFVVIHLGLIVCRGRYQVLQLLLCFDSRSDNKGVCFLQSSSNVKKLFSFWMCLLTCGDWRGEIQKCK